MEEKREVGHPSRLLSHAARGEKGRGGGGGLKKEGGSHSSWHHNRASFVFAASGAEAFLKRVWMTPPRWHDSVPGGTFPGSQQRMDTGLCRRSPPPTPKKYLLEGHNTAGVRPQGIPALHP